jgi:hypothetical protein
VPKVTFFQQKTCRVPTLTGWIALVAAALVITVGAGRLAMPFLAANRPVHGRYLVVEGWMADYGIEAAMKIQREGGYEKIITTGTGIEKGRHFSSANSYAEMAGKTLVKLGFDPTKLVVLPSPQVERDRTFTTGLAVGRWLRANNSSAAVDLLSIGPHARRSWILYEKALGKRNSVGVISIPNEDYDPGHWWRSSAGFRETTAEMIAYLYARFFFRGDPSASPPAAAPPGIETTPTPRREP